METNLESSPGRSVVVDVEDVSVRLQRREVLSAASLTIRANEIVTLIGPNGAGKTTLLRVVLGLLPPDRGRVWVRPGLRIGYMPQRVVVERVLPLTVRRFLSLGGRATSAAAAAVLDDVGARHTLETPIQEVSGGEMQRVLLARALLRDPQLLVLDEPAQGVDVQGQVELFQLITRIRDERGCTVLMVSHDLHLVMASTDRVVCLNQRVCCMGSPAAVRREQGYLELFRPLGAPGLAMYAHHHGSGAKGEGVGEPRDRSGEALDVGRDGDG